MPYIVGYEGHNRGQTPSRLCIIGPFKNPNLIMDWLQENNTIVNLTAFDIVDLATVDEKPVLLNLNLEVQKEAAGGCYVMRVADDSKGFNLVGPHLSMEAACTWGVRDSIKRHYNNKWFACNLSDPTAIRRLDIYQMAECA